MAVDVDHFHVLAGDLYLLARHRPALRLRGVGDSPREAVRETRTGDGGGAKKKITAFGDKVSAGHEHASPACFQLSWVPRARFGDRPGQVKRRCVRGASSTRRSYP
jgi:hypothetical protein